MTTKEWKRIKDIGNNIIRDYTYGVIAYQDLQNMYAILDANGITVDCLSFDAKSCAWYYGGEQAPDSLYVYSIYKYDTGKIDANIYLS